VRIVATRCSGYVLIAERGACVGDLDGGSDDEPLNEDWTWKVDACKESVCLARAGTGRSLKIGTGWVVRNDTTTALVTARHVLNGTIGTGKGGVEPVITGKVTAVFRGGREVELGGCCARVLLVPSVAGDATSEPPDVAVVVLPERRRFPARPAPCLLDVTSAADVGGGGKRTLLHHPDGITESAVEHSGQLVVDASSASAAAPPWEVH